MENKINGLLALLEFASPRIRSLSLKLGLKVGEQWNLWWERMRVMDLGAMENLTFEVWRRGMTTDGMRLPPDIDVIALPDAVSSLRSLSLSQTSIAPNSLALSKLVHLTLRSALFGTWPYNHLFKVLQGCQTLEELELMGSGVQLNARDASYSADRLPSVPRIQCPNLRRLTFFAVENHMVSLVLTNLTAPSLDVVSLETPKGFKPDIPFTWIKPPNPIPFDSVRVLLITDRPGLDLDHQDHFALLLATLFPEIERMEIPSIRCRPLLTTWGEPVNIALNPWKDLQSIVLRYREDRCYRHSDEIMQETLRFLTARRRFGCPPLKRLRLGGCDKCQYSNRDRVEGGIKSVLESNDALELVELIHYSAADQF